MALSRLTLLVAAFLVLAAPASAADSIEGTWHFGGGQVLVEPTGGGSFKGTVVQATRFAECVHPVGQRMWEIARRADGNYTGTHVWYRDTDCSEIPDGPSFWRVREEAERFVLDFCTRRRGEPAPDGFGQGECASLERAKPPAPRGPALLSDPVLGDFVLSPPSDATTTGCLRRTVRHRFSVRRLVTRTRRGQRRPRIRYVRFLLNGRPIHRDRRSPYVAKVRGSRLRAGARYTVRAQVYLRRPGTRRTYRRTLRYRFSVCER